jgi:hypothetical protein
MELFLDSFWNSYVVLATSICHRYNLFGTFPNKKTIKYANALPMTGQVCPLRPTWWQVDVNNAIE